MIRPLRRWHSRWLQYDPPLPGASPATFVGKTCQRLNQVKIPGKYIPVFLAHTHTVLNFPCLNALPIIIGSQIIWNCEAILVSKPCVYLVFNGLGDPASAASAGYHLILLLAHVVNPNKVSSIRYTPRKLTWKANISILARESLQNHDFCFLWSRCLFLQHSCILAFYRTILESDWNNQSYQITSIVYTCLQWIRTDSDSPNDGLVSLVVISNGRK